MIKLQEMKESLEVDNQLCSVLLLQSYLVAKISNFHLQQLFVAQNNNYNNNNKSICQALF